MGVTGGGNVEGIDGRVDGDEGSVVRRGDPSTQSLGLPWYLTFLSECERKTRCRFITFGCLSSRSSCKGGERVCKVFSNKIANISGKF